MTILFTSQSFSANGINSRYLFRKKLLSSRLISREEKERPNEQAGTFLTTAHFSKGRTRPNFSPLTLDFPARFYFSPQSTTANRSRPRTKPPHCFHLRALNLRKSVKLRQETICLSALFPDGDKGDNVDLKKHRISKGAF